MKPILFNTNMVQAILDGRKTVTRRQIKPQPDIDLSREHQVYAPVNQMHGLIKTIRYSTVQSYIKHHSPYQDGDILYVRETYKRNMDGYTGIDFGGYIYKADCKHVFKDEYNPWHPSIHMPKEAARIFLRVNAVKAERLRDINSQGRHDDVIKEGYPFSYKAGSPLHDFVFLWNSTIKKSNLDIYDWHANPWVWVIEFEQISKEEALRSEQYPSNTAAHRLGSVKS